MPLTKQDIQKIENLMEGVMKNLATKEDLYQFATKEDLDQFPRKGDLHSFATREDLRQFVTKEDVGKLATKEDMKTLATKNDLAEVVDHLARLTGEHFMRLEYRMESIESALPLLRRPARS